MQVTETTIEIKSRDSLLEAIKRLEEKQKGQVDAIKKDMHSAYESLKPVHVVKTLVSELFTAPEIRKDIFHSGVGLGAGLLARKIVIGKSNNLFKRLLGYLVQVGVTNMVNSNEEEIESKGRNLIQRLIKRYHSPEKEQAEENEALKNNEQRDAEDLRPDRELPETD